MHLKKDYFLNATIGSIEPEKFKSFFISHLNRVYCTKIDLISRLPKLAEHANFKHLQYGILETLEDIKRQIVRIDEIYVLLETEFSKVGCEGIIMRAEDAYKELLMDINTPKLCDLAILFYMSVTESVEMCSFQVLQMAAVKLDSTHIKQLLKENFNEAKEDRTLMLSIIAEYLRS